MAAVLLGEPMLTLTTAPLGGHCRHSLCRTRASEESWNTSASTELFGLFGIAEGPRTFHITRLFWNACASATKVRCNFVRLGSENT